MKLIYKFLPWFFLALFASEVVAVLAPKPDGVYHVRDFGRLPVLMNGRVQPFDSVARNSLLQMRSTADVALEEVPAWKFWHHPEKLKSTAWLLELMSQPDKADDRPVFLIHHPELLSELGIENIGVEKSGLRYYTFNQLRPHIPEILEQNRQAEMVDDSSRNPLQRQVIKLGNAVFLYQKLKFTLCPQDESDMNAVLEQVQSTIPSGIQAFDLKDAGKPYDKAAYDHMLKIATEFDTLQHEPGAGQNYPLAIPPVDPKTSPDEWGNVGYGVMTSIQARELFPPLVWLENAIGAYREGDPALFNESVTKYSSWLQEYMPKEAAKGRHEFFFNDIKAFLHAMIIYIFALVLTGGSLLTFGTANQLSESLRRSAFYLIMLAGVVHTSGLIFRMVLEGRPPVTNLYSSAIFIGWGAMVLGLVLERIYRIGIGNGVASIAGFVTLMIAHNLALGGDTMEMLRAVLDTNFWLATHVVVVTLGYASTFVAGLLALGYVALGVFTPLLSQKLGDGGAKKSASGMDVGKALAKMVYGIVCFATLFSFVGTVLGGIWADQSWGRFWGWDPKENGALLIVIWNATILHARWGGIIRERGLMNMAIFGNIVTSFSWFGVNMLGIGLHSYGFMDAAFDWLRAFIVSQLIMIALGLTPRHFWRSFKTTAAAPGVSASKQPAAT